MTLKMHHRRKFQTVIIKKMVSVDVDGEGECKSTYITRWNFTDSIYSFNLQNFQLNYTKRRQRFLRDGIDDRAIIDCSEQTRDLL